MSEEYEDLGVAPDSSHLYRKSNGAGGHVYMTDCVGGGVFVWDTSLVPEGTLLAVMACEHRRRYVEDIKSRNEATLKTIAMEQAAATDGSFVPEILDGQRSQEEG